MSSKSDVQPAAQGALPVTRAAQVDQFFALCQAVPAAEEHDDGLDVALNVLNAQSWTDLNEDRTSLPQGKDMVGRTVVVRTLMRRPSDLENGLPFYFEMDGIDTANDRPLRWQCGAATVCGKLAMLYALGQLPAVVTILSQKTRKGTDALDLRIDAVAGA